MKAKDREEQSLGSFIGELVLYIVLIILITNLFSDHVLQRTIVEGWSMENSLYEGDNLFVEKLSYRYGEINRFDIIAFYPNGKGTEDYYIKRVIGLPGEHVQIDNDQIYINGILLEEDYGKTDSMGHSGIASEGIDLPDNEYFVLGDNRLESLDSRYEEIGLVEYNEIEGKAFVRIWPLNKIGTID